MKGWKNERLPFSGSKNEKKLWESVIILNLTLKELGIVAKSRNIDGY